MTGTVIARPSGAAWWGATATDLAERADDPEEERLVVEAQGGAIEAFNRLVRRYERQVYNLARRVVGRDDLAEEVTQETFLLAYRSLHQFRGGIFRAWLLRIATNRCYDELRRQRRRPAESFEGLGFEPRAQWSTLSVKEGPQERAERIELAGILEAALQELPDDQRVAVVLSDVQGYSDAEIATIVGVPVGTVRSRLSRGRGRLRTALGTALPLPRLAWAPA